MLKSLKEGRLWPGSLLQSSSSLHVLLLHTLAHPHLSATPVLASLRFCVPQKVFCEVREDHPYALCFIALFWKLYIEL